jgi:hypothetical protein
VQHIASKKPAKCVICSKDESSLGTFPMVIGIGRVCMSCGMQKIRCEVCGEEVKRLTSSRFQGRNLCLKDHMNEVEKYKQHIVKTYDEENEPIKVILEKIISEQPEGYTLIAFRRGRNSTHIWEAEYEKAEIFQMRCS